MNVPKNIVVCSDGTGNGIEPNLSNVLKLYRMARKSPLQRVFYGPGVGTLSEDDEWATVKQNTQLVLGLATGWGIDQDILDGYRFVVESYAPGDRIYLFGFSRGAYTVRALAGLLHTVGLLAPDQLNLAGNALAAFKHIKSEGNFDGVRQFVRVTGAHSVPIRFIGVWDTVASVLVPRREHLHIPTQMYLPYTRRNPSVETFRQALAIDERRRMFRAYRWTTPQMHEPRWYAPEAEQRPQDIRQVWFAGVHSDVGGGYPESQSGLAKYPLDWMIQQAAEHGLDVDAGLRAHLVEGKPLPGGQRMYTPPSVTAPAHESLQGAWLALEWLPKSEKYRDVAPEHRRPSGWYLPGGERRYIAAGSRIHWSVKARMEALPGVYAPPNLPATYEIEAPSQD